VLAIESKPEKKKKKKKPKQDNTVPGTGGPATENTSPTK
jgi:hypothetical protein